MYFSCINSYVMKKRIARKNDWEVYIGEICLDKYVWHVQHIFEQSLIFGYLHLFVDHKQGKHT